MHWMILPFKRYAEFTGRSRRMEYWMFTLFNVIVMVVLALIAFGGLNMANLADPASDEMIIASLTGGFGLIVLLYFLVILVPSIAVTVRRLHDRNMSGWWYLGFFVGGLLPYVGLLFSIALLVLMLLPGTPGPNRFGDDPKGRVATDVFE
jgi:uncharacterized membrane protein YhaH (DUF805 family)